MTSWLLPIAAALLGDPLFAPEETRQGPPIQQLVKQGTLGESIDYEDFREVYRGSAELGRRRHPFAGADYAVRGYRHSVMQGRTVFRYRDRPRWLVHNFFCWQLAGTAEMPWSCESTAFVFKGGRPVAERGGSPAPEDGFALLDPEDVAEVEGDFDHVVPHPSQQVFAAIRLGCCGSESRVSVHDLDGRTLCPAGELLIGWAAPGADPGAVGVWDKLKVQQGQVDCPGGGHAKLPPPSP